VQVVPAVHNTFVHHPIVGPCSPPPSTTCSPNSTPSHTNTPHHHPRQSAIFLALLTSTPVRVTPPPTPPPSPPPTLISLSLSLSLLPPLLSHTKPWTVGRGDGTAAAHRQPPKHSGSLIFHSLSLPTLHTRLHTRMAYRSCSEAWSFARHDVLP
jgi:hypothetical protein